ncbi:MAG: AEC family transporter [Deltaproteobacteria bacterium]|nr:AEC family transporter [Deltaproteobacteria bacterium]
MEIVITTFESVAVLLGIGILGFSIVVRRILPEDALGVLTTVAIDIALPCLIFANIILNFQPAGMPGWYFLPLWWVGFTLLAGILSGLCSLFSRPETRSEFAATLFYQNAIFFPLAVLTGMFGNSSTQVVSLFLFTMFSPSFFFSTYQFFFGGAGRAVDWKKVFNIILIVTVAATALSVAGAQGVIPGFLVRSFLMVGAMAIPLLMIILGGNIYVDYRNKGSLYPGEVVKFVIMKNFLFPLVMLGVLLIVRPAHDVALILLLESAVPPITAMPIVVERAGGNRNIVNQFMFASFITALVSIPVMVLLFEYFFASP